MDQIERISKYEEIFDEALRRLECAERGNLKNLKEYEGKIEELRAYYESSSWLKDFDDSNDGKLPGNIKCGVLSEDGVYNLLMEMDEIL